MLEQFRRQRPTTSDNQTNTVTERARSGNDSSSINITLNTLQVLSVMVFSAKLLNGTIYTASQPVNGRH